MSISCRNRNRRPGMALLHRRPARSSFNGCRATPNMDLRFSRFEAWHGCSGVGADQSAFSGSGRISGGSIRTGNTESAEGARRNLRQASDIAQYLGGKASVCNTDLAACLKSVLDTSSHGWIIRIAGPPVDWTEDSAKVLNVWYAPDRGVLDLTRPFVRLEKPRLKSDKRLPGTRPVHPWHEVAPSVPLFDSVALSGKPGCAAGTGSETEKLAMTAIVPDAVVRGLRTYVEVLSVTSGPPDGKLTAKQREAAMLSQHVQFHTRSAPELVRETGQGTAEVCIDLPPTSRRDWSYWIIVFNREAGWAGVGFLPVADVVSAQRRR